MSLSLVILLSSLASAIGAALLVVAQHSDADLAVALVAGAALVASGLLGQVFLFVALRGAVARLCGYAESLDGNAAPPDLPRPFDQLARRFSDKIDEVSSRLSQRNAEARRVRVAARSLQQQHDVTLSLLESLSDGVILFDSAGMPVLVNRAARAFLDLDPAATLDASLASVRNAALEKALRQAIAGLPDSRGARDIDCSDQTRRRVLCLLFLEVRNRALEADEDASLAAIVRDVTRERELNRMKSDFASSVSHELKTPLSSMRAFLEMLLDGDIDGEEERHEHIQKILDETERLTQLVQNLLNLSRLESGVTRMEREPIAIDEVVDHLRQVVTPLAEARHQTMLFEVSEFLPPVMGDRTLLEQALMNLVSNAIKYTPEGGTIKLRAVLSGSMVEVAVKDTGVGIPARALERIFEKFTRIENHSGLKATGTGLGLPLAKFVAEAHGGKISVQSEVGQGSEFRMVLPGRKGQEATGSRLVGLEGIA